MTTPLVQKPLIDRLHFEAAALIATKGRTDESSDVRLLREAAEALAGRAEPVGYTSQDALSSLASDDASGVVFGTFSERYERTIPLYLTPSRAWGGEVGDRWVHSGNDDPMPDVWLAAAYEGTPPFGAMLTVLGDWIDLEGNELTERPDWWIYPPVAQDDIAAIAAIAALHGAWARGGAE